MTLPKFLFVAIDKLFDGSQNKRKCTRFEDRNIVVETDIVYDKQYEDCCKLDTYHIEKKDGKYPVFFYIHGGGFVAGDKHYRRAMSRWAADKGYFVVNVNYALSPEYLFPTALKNLAAALNWVEENAERLRLDTDRMVVSGDSAGGYYSAMLACMTTNKDIQNKLGVSTNLKFGAAILNCGIYEVGIALNRKMPFRLTDRILFDFAGIHLQQFDSYEWKEICAPYNFVDETFPKSLVIYAEKDFFCKGQSQMLIEKLNKLGVYNEEIHSTSFFKNHCYSLNWNGKAERAAVDASTEFLKKFEEGKLN